MNLRPEFLSPLRTLTGIDSPSGDAEGVTKAGDVMEGIFRNLGWETDRPKSVPMAARAFSGITGVRNPLTSCSARIWTRCTQEGAPRATPSESMRASPFGPGVADDRSGLAAIAAIGIRPSRCRERPSFA